MVLDASAAFYLCSDPEGIESLAALQPSAPALLWSEFTALLSQRQWRGEIAADVAGELLDVLLRADIRRVATDELYRAASDVAIELGWAKTYDAEYVALALLTDTALVTLDARLQRRASRLVTVLSPDEALA